MNQTNKNEMPAPSDISFLVIMGTIYGVGTRNRGTKTKDSAPISDGPRNQGTNTKDSASIASGPQNQGTKTRDSASISDGPRNQETKTEDSASIASDPQNQSLLTFLFFFHAQSLHSTLQFNRVMRDDKCLGKSIIIFIFMAFW